MILLSPQSSNAKLSKNSSVTDQWETSILYLAPATMADGKTNLCPASTPGCRAACLNTAGRGQMSSVQIARQKKALLFIKNRWEFMFRLDQDLEYLVRKQIRTGIKQAVRLNGTSDIAWERQETYRGNQKFDGVPQAFPELQFYDYTKIIARTQITQPSNYHLTYSSHEASRVTNRLALYNGFNVAQVFFDVLPLEYLGYPVIDGTKHDMRFLDPKGVIVGLVAKGKAKQDLTGFVQRNIV